MKRLLGIVLVLLAICCLNVAAMAGVDVSKNGDGYSVRTSSYEAVFASDGCLTNLRIGGAEFLKSGIDVSRGVYYFNNPGAAKYANISAADSVVSATSKDADVSCSFHENKLEWTVKNNTADTAIFYMIIDPHVRMLKTGDGIYRKTPAVVVPADTTTWFAGGKAVRISGTSKTWGPWESGAQILDTDLAAGETKKVSLSVVAATDAEDKMLANINVGRPMDYNGMTLLSPAENRVFQRHSKNFGTILVSGRVDVECDSMEYCITGKTPFGKLSEEWKSISLNPVTHDFNQNMEVPAGGWYKFQIRAISKKQIVCQKTLSKIGVGEVFVGAGQSNSTNCAQFPSKQTTGMVSCFTGDDWEIRDDPFPGTHDNSLGGSYYPTFGDAMYNKYHVPIGIASTGHGGTSVSEWLPGGGLFSWMMNRIEQLGVGGFRAVLWHQGEADAKGSADDYYKGLTGIIRDSNRLAGWSFPWFVANASYWHQDNPSFPGVRGAQQKIWATGVALQGPDTDTLVGPMRDHDGDGIHLSLKGLAAHGLLWEKQVSAYLDEILNK